MGEAFYGHPHSLGGVTVTGKKALNNRSCSDCFEFKVYQRRITCKYGLLKRGGKVVSFDVNIPAHTMWNKAKSCPSYKPMED